MSDPNRKTARNDGHLIQPRAASPAEFPESTVFAEGIRVLPADNSARSCMIHTGVPYATKDGMALHLHIIEPRQGEDENLVFPLLMFVQGSGWRLQNTGASLASLSRFAQRGYVIAVVQYRPSSLAPFPAQVLDTKTALRFMRAHAATYHADPDRVVVWGDSSGGHTAVMVGVTLDNAAVDECDPADDPLPVAAIVDYYGPTDISRMNDEPSTMDHIAADSPEGMLIGGVPVLENMDLVAPTVTSSYISAERELPPFLIIHGNKDRLVPFGQSVMLYEALRDAGKVVECYQLAGADHGGSAFWTEQVLDIVEAFITRYL